MLQQICFMKVLRSVEVELDLLSCGVYDVIMQLLYIDLIATVHISNENGMWYVCVPILPLQSFVLWYAATSAYCVQDDNFVCIAAGLVYGTNAVDGVKFAFVINTVFYLTGLCPCVTSSPQVGY